MPRKPSIFLTHLGLSLFVRSKISSNSYINVFLVCMEKLALLQIKIMHGYV